MTKFYFGLISTLFLFNCNNSVKYNDNETKKTIEKDTIKQTDKSNLNIEVQKDFTSLFCKNFDISDAFDSLYYGAFGDNYYRIDLIIDSVRKKSNCIYNIYGCTILKGKKVGYSGEIKINEVEKHNENLYGFNDLTNFLTKISAEYTLSEDQSVSGSGIFQGSLFLTFHITKDNIIDYDTREWMGDGYSNYIFDGSWISKNGKKYIAYFGDGKLGIGDLNVGDGEFVPNKKYVKNGWFDYAEWYYSDDSILMSEIVKIKMELEK